MQARGQASVEAVLEPRVPRIAGAWRVQVAVGNRILAEAPFTVANVPPDRRP